MSVVQIDTHHPIQDLIEVRDFLDHVIRRRQSTEREPIKPQSVEEQLAIAGKPVVNLKDGAPENKLAHLVTETKAADTLDAPEKPKRGRPAKPVVTKTITVDEVRALMVELGSKGVDEQTRQKGILTDMGFEKLSQVPPERLVELLAKIKEGMQ